jgi:hypothetical protein
MTTASATWSQVSARLFDTTQSVLPVSTAKPQIAMDGVNDAEDLKPHSRWSHAACLEQKDDTRRKVNDVVCQLTWNVLSSIPSGVAAGTKPRIPTTKKTRPKITANVLTILISYWLKKLRLWQALRR